MIEIENTSLVLDDLSQIHYFASSNNFVEVFIPFSASSVTNKSSVKAPSKWCSDFTILKPLYQPQGNIWFVHFKVTRNNSNNRDRHFDVEISIVTEESETPHVITHHITQVACKCYSKAECYIDSVEILTTKYMNLIQDCSKIFDEEEDFAAIIQDCEVEEKEDVIEQECED